MRRPTTRFHPDMIDSMILLNHSERLPLIVKWHLRGKLSPQQLNGLLSDWWTHGGYAADLRLNPDYWPHLFRSAGFVTSEPGRRPPMEPVEIFRGSAPDSVLSLSWSTEITVAAWFAQRLKSTGMTAVVRRAVAPPAAILGMFDDRDEFEVVVDPKLLLPDQHRIVPEHIWQSLDRNSMIM